MVRVAGVEPTASWTRTMRATNCATPGYSLLLYGIFLDLSRSYCQKSPHRLQKKKKDGEGAV